MMCGDVKCRGYKSLGVVLLLDREYLDGEGVLVGLDLGGDLPNGGLLRVALLVHAEHPLLLHALDLGV